MDMAGLGRARDFLLLIVVGLTIAASVGCAGRRYRRFQAQVEDQASVHLQCPIEHVSAEQTGDATWRVDACGAVVMYRCHRVPWVGMRCRRPRMEVEPIGAVAVAPAPPAPNAQGVHVEARLTVGGERAAPPATRTVQMHADVAAALGTLQESIRACLTDPSVLVVRWTADGSLVASLDGDQAGSSSDGCVQELFAHARVSPPGSAGVMVQEIN